jgi:hypothetical protein
MKFSPAPCCYVPHRSKYSDHLFHPDLKPVFSFLCERSSSTLTQVELHTHTSMHVHSCAHTHAHTHITMHVNSHVYIYTYTSYLGKGKTPNWCWLVANIPWLLILYQFFHGCKFNLLPNILTLPHFRKYHGSSTNTIKCNKIICTLLCYILKCAVLTITLTGLMTSGYAKYNGE